MLPYSGYCKQGVGANRHRLYSVIRQVVHLMEDIQQQMHRVLWMEEMQERMHPTVWTEVYRVGLHRTMVVVPEPLVHLPMTEADLGRWVVQH
jgi:hypothetical protein